MQCPKCNNETYIDHVNPNTGKYAYVCVNKRCEDYRKAVYLTGEGTEAQITDTEPVREEPTEETPIEEG